MRVCPECGYVDPAEWRHSKYSYWIDFCTVEYFQKAHPELFKRLRQGEKLVEDKNYVYRMSGKKRRVERKALIDYGHQFSIDMEKGHKDDTRPIWKRDPNQKKLFDLHDTRKMWKRDPNQKKLEGKT